VDRLRHLSRPAALLAALFVVMCQERAGPAPPPQTGERFAGVARAPRPETSASGFCERAWPASGPEARKYVAPPERPLPGVTAVAAGGTSAGAWTWVNLWATWCAPCIEEMGRLGRWRDALAREGRTVALDLVTIDAEEDAGKLATFIRKGVPGRVRWLRGEADFPLFLDGLGVDRGAAIPIHALVDPAGMLRCVRVGAIHDEDWAAVRGLLGVR
jgi:thiol-disulfide isomerase/thioredoxin